MSAPSPPISPILQKTLRSLGQRLRTRRKDLGVSAAASAEAAGMSRVTLYRIEKGEASVTMGAYLSVVSTLGLDLELSEKHNERSRASRSRSSGLKLSPRVKLADYAQLKKLAWQLKDTKEISPKEALELYERNWRHVDLKTMSPREREFIQALLAAFGRERLLV